MALGHPNISKETNAAEYAENSDDEEEDSDDVVDSNMSEDNLETGIYIFFRSHIFPHPPFWRIFSFTFKGSLGQSPPKRMLLRDAFFHQISSQAHISIKMENI